MRLFAVHSKAERETSRQFVLLEMSRSLLRTPPLELCHKEPKEKTTKKNPTRFNLAVLRSPAKSLTSSGLKEIPTKDKKLKKLRGWLHQVSVAFCSPAKSLTFVRKALFFSAKS